MALKVLVLHGPNLNLLGQREPSIYGTTTLAQIDAALAAEALSLGQTLGRPIQLRSAQSNHEGVLIDHIQAAAGRDHGIVFNPAAYTHTSLALADALRAIDCPCVEVHLSAVHARNAARHHSYTAAACLGTITGFGAQSYLLGLRALVNYLISRPDQGPADRPSLRSDPCAN